MCAMEEDKIERVCVRSTEHCPINVSWFVPCYHVGERDSMPRCSGCWSAQVLIGHVEKLLGYIRTWKVENINGCFYFWFFNSFSLFIIL